MRKDWTKVRPKAARQIPNPFYHSSHQTTPQLSTPFSLLTATRFSLGLIPHPVGGLLSGYHTALASPASWDLQHNPDFTFTTSCNGIVGPPCRDTPGTHLAFI